MVGYAHKNSDHTQKGNHRVARQRQFRKACALLDDKDVRLLLRAVIEQEGSISAFARRHGLERSQLNKMLNGKRVVSRRVAKALGLGKVFTPSV